MNKESKPAGLSQPANLLVLALVFSAAVAATFITLRSDSLPARPLSELDSQIASDSVDTLVVEGETIEVYLKQSDNGLDAPDYVVRKDSEAALKDILPSLAPQFMENNLRLTIEYEFEPSPQSKLFAYAIRYAIPLGLVVVAAIIIVARLYKAKSS